MRQYTVQYRWPSPAGIWRNIGPARGYSLIQVIRFVGKCLTEGGCLGKIRFDNKEVLPAHKESIIEMANLATRISSMEKALTPRAAQRAQRNAIKKPN